MAGGENKIMTTELFRIAFIYYLIAFINLSCYFHVVFKGNAPKWLRFGAVGVGLLVLFNVLKTSNTFVKYLLS
jgi:hypothetical protein